MNVLSQATIQKIEALLSEGHSVRSVARALKLSRETCNKYARKSLARCECGRPRNHRGSCGLRYLKTFVHKELLAKVHSEFVEPPKPLPRPPLRRIRERYPYCPGQPGPGNALLRAVDDAVSKRIPDQDRCDICQELIVMLLAGEMEMSEIIGAAKEATTAQAAMFSPKFGDASLDAPVRGQDDPDIKLQNIISTEVSIFDAVPYGSSGTLRKRRHAETA